MATIGQTAGMIGHDIRNPLQTIAGELFLMKQDVDNAPNSQYKRTLQESLSLIQQQLDYMNKIVLDLQDYTRPLNPELVELELCTIIPQLLATVNIPSNIQALSRFDKRIPKVKLDKTFLKRILINLTTNAIQAMPSGGKLILNTFLEDGNIAITVQDNGMGIPEEIKPKLFQPLMTTKSKGQGFGLAVVKRLVEAQDGTISFESKMGEGTKFKLVFPNNPTNRD